MGQFLSSNLLGGGKQNFNGQKFRPQMWALFSATFF